MGRHRLLAISMALHLAACGDGRDPKPAEPARSNGVGAPATGGPTSPGPRAATAVPSVRVLLAGAPVKEARVRWFDAQSTDARVDVLTGDDGTATLPIGGVVPGRGRLEVRLDREGHGFADAIRDRWDATATPVEFLRVTARAIDVDGSPVPGAFVAWRQPRPLESGLHVVGGVLEADVSGVVTLPPVDAAAETYLVAARTRPAIPPDLEPDRVPLMPSRAGRRVLPADAGKTIDVRLIDARPK